MFDITSDAAGPLAVTSLEFIPQTIAGLSDRRRLERKRDVLSFHGSASRQKKFEQLRRVKFLVFPGIQPEENPAAGIKMALEVVEKEGPLGWFPPPILFADAIEIDRERRDQIELPAQIGKRLVRLNSPNAALDLKEIEQLGEERKLIDVQTEAGVPEMLKHEEKESAAAAKIEDRLRRTTVQFQILRADDVQPEPALHVRVFGVMLPRQGVLRLDFR